MHLARLNFVGAPPFSVKCAGESRAGRPCRNHADKKTGVGVGREAHALIPPPLKLVNFGYTLRRGKIAASENQRE